MDARRRTVMGMMVAGRIIDRCEEVVVGEEEREVVVGEIILVEAP
jgi:hypothetical protein